MAGRSSVVALPSAADPRMLVERRHSAAAATALRSFGAHLGTLPSMGTRGAAILLHLGGGILLPSATARWTERFRYIESRVRSAMGRDDVVVAVRLAPRRPNGKPVAQIMTPDGRTVAYAKVGWNPQARRLVHREAEVLAELHAAGPFTTMRVPEVIDVSDRDETTVLVLSDVRGTPIAHDATRMLPVLEEIASSGPRSTPSLAATAAWTDLAARLEEVATLDDSPIVSALVDASGSLVDRYGQIDVVTGRMHGDFIPANLGIASDRVGVWDWERSCTGAPIGLDAVHHAFATADGSDPAARVSDTLRRVRPLGEAMGLDPPTERALLMMDLLDRAVRYREGRRGGTTAVDTVSWRALRAMHEDVAT